MDFLPIVPFTFYLLHSSVCYADDYPEEINSTEGVVQSPNYPQFYPNNLRYTWRITVRERFTIQLLFTDFHLQSKNGGVCKDNLQIFDGKDENSLRIFNDCGKPFGNTFHSVFSSGNELFLKLTTDGGNQKKGFSGNFTSLQYYSEEIKSTEGVLQSPNYPQFYPNNLRYTWRITVRERFTIQLLFTDFHLQRKKQELCKDKLQIFDGEDENSLTLFQECGELFSHTPYSVFSSGNELFLKLTTDGSNRKRGFSAKFTSVPLTEIEGSSPTEGIINTTKAISTFVTTKATISTTTSTAELFHSSFLLNEQTTYSVLMTASPFEAFCSSTESTTKRPHISQFLRSSAPALFAIVGSVLLVLCLLAFGLFVTLKKSIKESLSPTTCHSYHGAETTNQGENVAQPPEFVVEDGKIQCCNTISVSKVVIINSEENGKDIENEGEIMNIVYESYDEGVNEDADLRGEDGGVGKSDLTCHEDGGAAKQDTTYAEVDGKDSANILYDDICPETEKGFESNIIYEPFDREG